MGDFFAIMNLGLPLAHEKDYLDVISRDIIHNITKSLIGNFMSNSVANENLKINHIGFHRLAIIVGIISISLVIFYNPLLADDNDYKDLNLNSLADTIDCIKDKEGSMNFLQAKNYCVSKKSKTVSSSELGSELNWNISGGMWFKKNSSGKYF